LGILRTEEQLNAFHGGQFLQRNPAFNVLFKRMNVGVEPEAFDIEFFSEPAYGFNGARGATVMKE